MSSQSSEQEAPELLPCPFCGNKAEHRNTWVWCTNVSCRAHTAGFKPAEWNTRSDICAAAKTALARRLITAHVNATGDYKQAERLMLEVLKDEGIDFYE